jgi:hypothetical protein
MTFLRKLSIATASASAILSVLSEPVSAFTITQASFLNSNWDLQDPLGNLDPGVTGTVTLNPLLATYLAPPAAQATFFTVFGAEAPNKFNGWTAVSGAALGGILAINEYDARDYATEPRNGYSTPRGGVDMRATYTKAATDPMIADLRFIQWFSDNAGPNGGLRSQVDQLPSNDQLPWYFPEALRTDYVTPTTMIFEDLPNDLVTIPFNRTVRFETYLATFDNTTKVATIHDGWSWGYDVQATQAVPEPLTILSSAVALGFGASFKKEFSRRRKKNA